MSDAFILVTLLLFFFFCFFFFFNDTATTEIYTLSLHDALPISRAKRVIFLMMNGGMSHVDTFDYKPMLDRKSTRLNSSHSQISYAVFCLKKKKKKIKKKQIITQKKQQHPLHPKTRYIITTSHYR